MSTKQVRPPVRASFPALYALCLVIAVCLIGLGQFVVGAGDAPFSWPGEGWLNDQFVKAFAVKTELAFATPLFITGAALFGLLARRTTNYESMPRPTGGRLGWPYLLALGVSTGTLLWLIVSLFHGDYEPAFRFMFVSGIGFAVCTLFARDLAEGRLRLVRPRRTLLLEVAAVAAVVAAFVAINIRDLTNWRYSSIGDEEGFFYVAQRILHDGHFNWFSVRGGVYDDHPVLGSVWHAVNLLVFGNDMFGWKMGALTAIAITLPVFYWLLRDLFSARVAVFGTIVLGASHYLFAYAHTGYNNIFPLFPTVAALACLVAGIKRGSPALLFLCGVVAGLGCYTFYSSRAIVIIVGLALLTMRDRRVQLQTTAWIAPAFAFTVLPLFASDRWSVIQATGHHSFLNSNVPIPELLGYNLIRSLFAFSFNPFEQHYTAGALMDGVSLTLAFAGLGLALVGLARFPYRLLVIWFVVAIFVTGVLSENDQVNISRLHYALPALAAFAGLALDALVSALSTLHRRPWFRYALTGATVAAVGPTLFILNARQFFIYSANHLLTNDVTVIVRETTNAKCDDYPLRTVIYRDGVDAPLDGVFPIIGWDDRRPVELAFRDLPWVYYGYGGSGGVGCLLVGDVTRDASARVANRLESEGGAMMQVVTDLTGQTKVGLIAPSARFRGIDASALAATWKTDFSKGSGLDGVIKAQEKHFLPSLDGLPTTVSPDEVPLTQNEPTVLVRVGGYTRSYPVRFLMWHGVVNDIVNGVPIVVAYDPIADSAQAFDRRVGDQTYTFAVTGFMRDGNALLYDLETETWWQQLSGLAVTGAFAGTQLKPVEFHLVSSTAYHLLAARSHGDVDTMAPPMKGIAYGRNPYLHYDGPDAKPVLTLAPTDSRLRPLQRVAVIEAGGERVAVPFPEGKQRKNLATTVSVGRRAVALFFDASIQSAVDARQLFTSRQVGGFAAFETQPTAVWSTDPHSGSFLDGSGSRWDILGEARDGPAKGTHLTPVICHSAFWFSASALFPGIQVHSLELR